MPRPIYFDLTHLSARLWTDAPAGIDRVDRLFAQMLDAPGSGFADGVHQGPLGAVRVSRRRARALVARIERRWREDLTDASADPLFDEIVRWLSAVTPSPAAGAIRIGNPRQQLHRAFRLHTLYRHSFAAGTAALRGVPAGAIYLNASQWGLGEPSNYGWLARRPDVKPVFFIHDVLPLDVPEYFQPDVPARFRAMAKTLATHAAALITASRDVAVRISARIAAEGGKPLPILTAPLPAFDADMSPPHFVAALAERPYFVAVGTVEPRKNHLLLLNLWRTLAANSADVPRLVLVGARGWHNQQILDMLERSPGLAGKVAEVGGLSSAALRSLLAHSAGLLFPSFAEGFGLPLVEAASLGVPIIASDIPVLREVAGGAAIYRDPLDGPGWSAAIRGLATSFDPAGIPARIAQRRIDGRAAFFNSVREFLQAL